MVGQTRLRIAGSVLIILTACSGLPGPSPSLTPTAYSLPTPALHPNPFGLHLPTLGRSPQGIAFAAGLGVAYFRPEAIFLDRWNGQCPSCDLALRANLKLVLTVRNNGPRATSPPKDLATYRRKLGEVLAKYRPALLVVENEENSELFYAGTPDDYRTELTAACQVAHQKSIPCTNGGLVSTLVALLVYDNYLGSGDVTAAENFRTRAFNPDQWQALQSGQAREQLERGRVLLTMYRTASIDYVNFHWYISDGIALEEAVRFLKSQTGLQPVTNEVGQLTEEPEHTKAIMAKITELQIPIAVWFGQDALHARGLVDANGHMRSTGEAFREFILQNYR